jgi:hypothetical protein
VSVAKSLLVDGVVEHQRLVELDLTLSNDFRYAPPRRTEPALAHHTVTVLPGSGARISHPVVKRFRHSSGLPSEEWERPVVAGDAAVDSEELERNRRLPLIHRKVPTDREDGDIRAHRSGQ